MKYIFYSVIAVCVTAIIIAIIVTDNLWNAIPFICVIAFIAWALDLFDWLLCPSGLFILLSKSFSYKTNVLNLW